MDERDFLVVAADVFPVLDFARQDADDLVFREVIDFVGLVNDEDERLDDDFVVVEGQDQLFLVEHDSSSSDVYRDCRRCL